MVLSFLKSVRQFLATRAAVVCIPYASVPGMDINSYAYLKASRTLAKSSEASTKPASSCAPCSTSAFHEYKSCLPSSKVIFLFSNLLILLTVSLRPPLSLALRPQGTSPISTLASFLKVRLSFVPIYLLLTCSLANDLMVHNPYAAEILSKVEALSNGFSKDSCATSELSLRTRIGELQAEMVHDLHKMASLYSRWQYNQSELVAVHKQLGVVAPK